MKHVCLIWRRRIESGLSSNFHMGSDITQETGFTHDTEALGMLN